MESICEAFCYYESDVSSISGSGYIATIAPGIFSADELFDVLFQALNFPGYFGFNWNALSDCLCDLSWIPERDVVLIHSDLPTIGDDEIKLYLDVLYESIRDWTPSEDHRFIVFFPVLYRARIVSLLATNEK